MLLNENIPNLESEKVKIAKKKTINKLHFSALTINNVIINATKVPANELAKPAATVINKTINNSALYVNKDLTT